MNTEPVDLPLRDIHLPDPISWWPIALGWWLLLAIAFGLLCISVFLLWRYLRPSLKKEATKQLDSIEANFIDTDNAPICLAELSIFLRRIMLSKHPSEKHASLTGQLWLEALDQLVQSTAFTQGAGQILADGPYQPHVEKEQAFELIQLCRQLVKTL